MRQIFFVMSYITLILFWKNGSLSADHLTWIIHYLTQYFVTFSSKVTSPGNMVDSFFPRPPHFRPAHPVYTIFLQSLYFQSFPPLLTTPSLHIFPHICTYLQHNKSTCTCRDKKPKFLEQKKKTKRWKHVNFYFKIGKLCDQLIFLFYSVHH